MPAPRRSTCRATAARAAWRPKTRCAAFEVALQHGVTTLELDIAITRDGVLVIHHDLALNPAFARDAQGRWLEEPGPPIHTHDWDELQRYDVGRLKPGQRYSANYPDQGRPTARACRAWRPVRRW